MNKKLTVFGFDQVNASLERKKNQFREIINADLDDCVFQTLVHEKYGSFTFTPSHLVSPTKDDVIVVNPTFKVGDKIEVQEPLLLDLYSQLTIEITGISVQRINNICATDALAEGIAHTEFWQPDALNSADFDEKWWDDFHFWNHYPQLAFANWWKSKFGEESWNANKWVWVYRFKVSKN